MYIINFIIYLKGRLITRMNTRLADRRADGKQTLPTAQNKNDQDVSGEFLCDWKQAYGLH